MVTAMRAPVGGFRDWDAVDRWAAEVAAQAAEEAAVVPARR